MTGTSAKRPSEQSGWEREWAYVQDRAGAPREVRLGCSTISHKRLGFCALCVPARRDNGPNGTDLELGAWRLLALEPPTASAGSVAPEPTP